MGLVEFGSFERGLHPCSNIVLSANKYIRKMNGGSQSIFVHANDGRHYIVKMQGNPAGPNVLVNEYMGSVIAEAVGLPVVPHKGILLSDSFIDSHPELWFELPSGNVRPEKGIHFASQFVGQISGADRTTEYISPSKIYRIKNREAFLGMYLLDVWANHQDHRQALLSATSGGEREVVFIDHGHMFGGPNWNFEDMNSCALHLELAVYTNLWQDEKIASWISKFQSVIPKVLESLAHTPVVHKIEGDFTNLFVKLLARLANLQEVIEADFERHWDMIQKKSLDETLQLSDSGIYDLRTASARSSVYRRRATA